MSVSARDGDELTRIYRNRFKGQKEYRLAVWRILIGAVFARWIPADGQILDLGAGHPYSMSKSFAPPLWGVWLYGVPWRWPSSGRPV